MNKEYYYLLGKKLEYCRKAVDITQEQMGKIAGLDNRKIHRYENNHTIIPIKTLYIYSYTFKIPMHIFANENISLEKFMKIYPESYFALLEPTFEHFFGKNNQFKHN